MTVCEKCWADASAYAQLTGAHIVDEYYRLLKEREKEPCSLEEQRGEVDKGWIQRARAACAEQQTKENGK